MNTEKNNPHWYCVNTIGMATLCRDEADARREAADADAMWPRHAPHVATQLVPMAEIERLRGRVAELEQHSKRYRYLSGLIKSDPDMSGNHRWWRLQPYQQLRGPTIHDAIDAALAKDGA